MDPPTPEQPASERPISSRAPSTSWPADAPVGTRVPESDGGERGDAVLPTPNAPLGELLVAMQSLSATERDAAWATCYAQYYRVVWTYVFYVVRSIASLPEPGRVAEDVTSEVFLGLPEAAAHYREKGLAEWWLKQVAVRRALRKKEAETGQWAAGKSAPGGGVAKRDRTGRIRLSFDETADQIVGLLESVERDAERMELDRRRAALRSSPDPKERRWAEFLDLYVAGFDFEEIGERMEMTEATARNWLCNIRKHLARPLER
jgi:RNA polymerase sigma factor (sigma-70 family)